MLLYFSILIFVVPTLRFETDDIFVWRYRAKALSHWRRLFAGSHFVIKISKFL